jgi:hypothetical protein
MIFESTWPKARKKRLDLKPGHRYSVYRWTAYPLLTPDDIDYMKATSEGLVGHWYDILQLGGFWVKAKLDRLLQKILPKPVIPMLGIGREEMVCSVAAIAVLRAVYYLAKANGIVLPKPLGNRWIEYVCPADPANDPTFVLVSE